MRDAARLTLRSGAGPFRSLGRISVRPRPYQYVPLLMALRLDPVRLLIADDVGVGKTVEAGLIAKELLERGEARRLLVLCPPVLCEQWQRELRDKFHIDAVIVRTSTQRQLERNLPLGSTASVYSYYEHLIVSIDYAKTERQRDLLLAGCPDLVIVDEAHGAARPPSSSGRSAQQLRHDLVREIAQDRSRHLILLTATPHSGIRESFASLLGLLDPELEALALQERLSQTDRRRLARHFVQRRRRDVEKWLGEATPFPDRDPHEIPYKLGDDYLALFQDVLAFAKERVRQPGLARHHQRMRYWGALALLRSVMSSPAAAIKAFERREGRDAEAEGEAAAASPEEAEALDLLRRREVLDVTAEEAVPDAVPDSAIEDVVRGLGRRDRQRLAEFRCRAEALRDDRDAKLQKLISTVRAWLREGYHPIVYCRFVETARYVAERLQAALEKDFPRLRVAAVVGEMADEERAARIADLAESPRRVLVATDCLSEGIDLQYAFNAVIHYDLPWNPNRLEQREGRVDRYGQPSRKVRTAVLYGTNNEMDLTVLRVLIRKARAIYQDLGVTVPVPVDSEAIMESLLEVLFQERSRSGDPEQLALPLADFQRAWEEAARREKETRSIFAQHGLQRHEVEPELRETEAVLGTPRDVRAFWLDAAQRFELPVQAEGERVRVPVAALERQHFDLSVLPPGRKAETVELVFDSPAPEGAVLLHRNHPWVEDLAHRVLGEALAPEGRAGLARCGAIVTTAVERRTALVVLRLRFQIHQSRGRPDLYAEEVVVTGFVREGGRVRWLEPNGEEVRALLKARPSANMADVERRRHARWALDTLEAEAEGLEALSRKRAERLAEAHNRLRQVVGGGRVTATAYSPDVLAVYVLVPGER